MSEYKEKEVSLHSELNKLRANLQKEEENVKQLTDENQDLKQDLGIHFSDLLMTLNFSNEVRTWKALKSNIKDFQQYCMCRKRKI